MSEENAFITRTSPIDTRPGAENRPCSDNFGSLIVLSSGGRLQTACDGGRLFAVANQAAVATSVSLDTAWTGLGLSNPTGSGYKLILHEFGWSAAVIPDDDGIVSLATTTNSGFAAAITPRNRKFGGGPASIAVVDDGATIVAPVIEQICGTYGHPANTTVQISVQPQVIKLAGSIIVLPGRAVVTDTTTATGAALLFYFIWEEVRL